MGSLKDKVVTEGLGKVHLSKKLLLDELKELKKHEKRFNLLKGIRISSEFVSADEVELLLLKSRISYYKDKHDQEPTHEDE